jgi:pre-rRNA-processing protein TSR4
MQPSAPNPFGLGTQIFSDSSAKADTPAKETGETIDAESVESSSSNESLIIAMASTTIGPSPWASAPSYSPLYLSTTSEYLPPPPKAKLSPGTQVQDSADDEGKEDGKSGSWTFEAYENSLQVDNVLDRFMKRVGYEGEQCVRYELKGVPLAFASDKVLDLLFPIPPTPPLPVTKAAFKVVPVQKRIYDPTPLSPCPLCKSKRVFECQLMPNLINILRSGEIEKKLTDEERRKAVEKALKGGDTPDTRGMGWGTCMIFSCEKDCCIDDDGQFEARECWREELVLVQWDD